MKAEITNTGKEFTTYKDFAIKHGYPDAAAIADDEDTRKRLRNGDIVTLLTSGPHLSGYRGDTLWIVQAANGERHIINETGLRIFADAPITVLPDESLSGVLREYREVKRKARVGERIKYVWPGQPTRYNVAASADDSSVTLHDEYESEDGEGTVCGWGVEAYVVLEPTDNVHIDDTDGVNRSYRMVDRKAAVGERVIIVNAVEEAPEDYGYENGQVYEAKGFTGTDPDIWTDGTEDSAIYLNRGEYRVLEPLDSAAPPPLSMQPATLLSSRPSSDQIAENIAALTAKVQAIESRVAALEKAGEAHKLPEPIAKLDVMKSAQQLRDEIVERAKADVKRLSETPRQGIKNNAGRIGFWPYIAGGGESYMPIDYVEFSVNCEKRTVVAMIRSDERGVWLRGIAKCAPNDVFNSHIGRAISLRRALGLEVPAEYLSVPNPTEIRVGDAVEATGLSAYLPGTSGPVVNTEANGLLYRNPHGTRRDGTIWAFKHDVSVIDDSREGAELSASSSAQKGAVA